MIFGTAGAEPEELFGDKADKKVGGDRLYAGCVIAVNADTGEYVWHFQTSAPDYHTENMHILLADVAHQWTETARGDHGAEERLHLCAG